MMNHNLFIFMIVIATQITLVFSQPHELTTQNFRQYFRCQLWEYQQTEIPQRNWLIMFMAPWCHYCKTFKPVYAQFQNQFVNQIIRESTSAQSISANSLDQILESSVQIAMVDCDANSQLCDYFAIQSYPTFIFLTQNKKAIKYTGKVSKQHLKNFVTYHNPQTDSNCQEVPIANTLFSQILKVIIEYKVIIIFALIVMITFGYVLGMAFATISNQKKEIATNKQMPSNKPHQHQDNKHKQIDKQENKKKTK